MATILHAKCYKGERILENDWLSSSDDDTSALAKYIIGTLAVVLGWEIYSLYLSHSLYQIDISFCIKKFYKYTNVQLFLQWTAANKVMCLVEICLIFFEIKKKVPMTKAH